MRILIDKSTEAFLYVKGKFNIMQTWKYIIVLDLKENTISNFFTTLYIHIVEIPTNKRTLTNLNFGK